MLNTARAPKANLEIVPAIAIAALVPAPAAESAGSDIVRCLRVQQWAKNLLVFIPMIVGHRFQLAPLEASVLAFVAFCLSASGAYVVNDLFDRKDDRQHPVNRKRPIAAGRVSAARAIPWVVVLWASALALGAAVSPMFLGAELLYVVATVAYSAFLKRYALLDVIVLAGLYTLRVYAGAFATGIHVSDWLLGFSMFFFLDLALLKRYRELRFGAQDARAYGGRGYLAEDVSQINTLGHVSGMAAVVVVALYIHSDEARLLYSRPAVLWLLCPLLFYFLANLWIRSDRDRLYDDLIVKVLRDRRAWCAGLLGAAILAVAAIT